MLKQKVASSTMQVMIVLLLVTSFVSALLQVHYAFTLVIFLLLILLVITWFVSYKVLDKKY